jgi:hypothetical protein
MNKKKPSPFLIVRTILLALLGFVLFLAFVFVMLHQGGERPTYEEKRMAERLEKLKAHQTRDEELLTTYGWVNEDGGVARLPIDRAMELTIEDLSKKEVRAAGPVNPPSPPAASAAPEAAAGQAASPAKPQAPAAQESVK